MKTATFVKEMSGFNGSTILWKLSKPADATVFKHGEVLPTKTEYVITSAVVVPETGPETYIFPADANGNVLSWLEMTGSYRGDLDHDRAIRNLGFEPVWK